MSGHNKWTQIKRKKGAEDQKRSKLFGLLAKTIALELRTANGDQNAAGVKRAVEKARAQNMPSDNIERALKKGAGGASENYEEVLYEAYGPGGAALILEGITDNKNRTVQELKHLLAQHGGSLAASGAALWAFQKNSSTSSEQVAGWQATNPLELNETDTQALVNLLDALEDNLDIKNITTNVAGF